MSLFNRTYTFVDGTTAYGSQVEAEIGNIVTVLNSLNSATTNWGQVSVSHATNVPLIADCASGSQHIADFKNNSVIKASIDSTGILTLVPTSNQIVLGTTRTITISAGTPASSSRTLTIPDPGANANIMLSAGNTTAMAMGSNKITGLANGTAATDAAAFGQIKYIQAIQGTDTTSSSSTTSAFADTGLTVTITPTSASNRIKITAHVCLRVAFNNNTVQGGLQLVRAGSNILTMTSIVTGSTAAGGSSLQDTLCTITYIDSPTTTSATIYKVQFNRQSAVGTITYNPSTTTQVIIVEEIV